MGLYKNNSGTLDPIAGTPDARLAQLDQLETQLGNHTVAKNVPSDAVFTDTTTGDLLTTKVAKTGSGTTVTSTIPAGTTMDNAVGTLLNNDAALNSAINDDNFSLLADVTTNSSDVTTNINYTDYKELLFIPYSVATSDMYNRAMKKISKNLLSLLKSLSSGKSYLQVYYGSSTNSSFVAQGALMYIDTNNLIHVYLTNMSGMRIYGRT